MNNNDLTPNLTFVGTTSNLTHGCEPCKFWQQQGNLTQPVNAALVTGSSSLLQLYDKNSRLHFLIATGAAISMFLAGLSHRFQKSDVTLQAENNSIKHQQFLTVNPWIWAPTSPHLAISWNWCDLTYHWHWFSVATQIVNGSGQTTPNWH